MKKTFCVELEVLRRDWFDADTGTEAILEAKANRYAQGEVVSAVAEEKLPDGVYDTVEELERPDLPERLEGP
jgi:hypothetical protein